MQKRIYTTSRKDTSVVYSRDYSDGLRAGRTPIDSRQRQDIFLTLHRPDLVQTGYGIHPASYATDSEGFCLGSKAVVA
jgi:hypothetical protein